MDLAHKLSTQLRSAEERAREFETEANHFRERAATAENWLVVIHNGVQQTFFQNQNKTSSNGHAWAGIQIVRLHQFVCGVLADIVNRRRSLI
jgi:hypothetical protein